MNYIITTTDGEALAHHGILGQKWGIRRYQNEDGSLTDTGKARLKKVQSRQIERLNFKKDFNNAQAENIQNTKKRVEQEGIYNQSVRSRYNSLRKELEDSKDDYFEYVNVREKMNDLAREGKDGTYKSYEKRVLNGIKKQYLVELDRKYADYIEAGKDFEIKKEKLMQMNMSDLLNSNKGYKEIKWEIKNQHKQ